MELDRLDWIALGHEDALDPTFPIIDPHHHLWHRGGSRYLAEELYEDLTATHNITDTVFVECMANYDKERSKELQPVGETYFVAEESERLEKLGGPKISGIVGFADLMLGNRVIEVLDEHAEAGRGLFRGIRHATAWSDDPEISISHSKPTQEMMREKLFLEGLTVLGEQGYSFDAWLYFDQIDELIDLALACPDIPIILNHLGAPLAIGRWKTKNSEVDKKWKDQLTKLSKSTNVYLKIGGIGMDNYFNTEWSSLKVPPSSELVANYWKDKITWVIDTFSPDRCMFESNFPVDRQTLPYSVLWNTFQRIADQYSHEEKRALFSGTASTVYKL